jgi:hypothetical protein
MQREFDTVGRILPKQIPVRKGIEPEIKSVGCILPCMFLVGEGETVAFQGRLNVSVFRHVVECRSIFCQGKRYHFFLYFIGGISASV